MFNPEVCTFTVPESQFKCEKGAFKDVDDVHLKEKGDPAATISSLDRTRTLYFNHLIAVILPDTLNITPSLAKTLQKDCDYYKLTKLSLAEFVKGDFLHNFIDKGTLTGLTVNRRIDVDDCFCITPTKELILSLTKETYHKFGLEGTVSQIYRKSKGRYIVKVQLNTLSAQRDSKHYARILRSLERLDACNFILTWEPPSSTICPSSIAKYFHDLSYNVELFKPLTYTSLSYNVRVPIIDLKTFDLEDTYDIVEWLGMFALGGDIKNEIDDYINTYTTPEPNEELGQVKSMVWKGLYSARQVDSLINELRNFIVEEDKNWGAIYVQGFSDAPVSFNTREQSYFDCGNNSYTLIIDKNDKYIIATNETSFKSLK